MKLEKNDIIEVLIDDNGLNGDGIAHVEGITVFVKNAIKDERVRARIVKTTSSLAFAIIDRILESSPFRTKPPCPYFSPCGGCCMQHIDYPHTLEIKRNSLITTLSKQGLNGLNIEKTVPSNKHFNYRNKLSLPVSGRAKDGSIKIGFFALGSHRIVDIDDCLLQSFDVKGLISILRQFMLENGIDGYDEEAHIGDIRHLTARKYKESIIITIVTKRALKARLKPLNEMLQKNYPNHYVLYANLNEKNTNVIYGNDFEFLGTNLDEKTLNTLPHPAAFFQVNDYIKDLIYDRTIKEFSLKGLDAIIDAYAGAGALSVDFSTLAKRVFSLEISLDAHNEALKNVTRSGAKNVECLNGDCGVILPRLLSRNYLNLANTAVLLDPPRKGVDNNALLALNKKTLRKIVYVSCNPATLARDLKLLSKAYSIEKITPFDMFPQTAELETVAILNGN